MLDKNALDCDVCFASGLNFAALLVIWNCLELSVPWNWTEFDVE